MEKAQVKNETDRDPNIESEEMIEIYIETDSGRIGSMVFLD